MDPSEERERQRACALLVLLVLGFVLFVLVSLYWLVCKILGVLG